MSFLDKQMTIFYILIVYKMKLGIFLTMRKGDLQRLDKEKMIFLKVLFFLISYTLVQGWPFMQEKEQCFFCF